MTCTEFLALLDDLIDDSVTPKMRSELQQHLGCCDHCVVTLNTTRKTIQGLPQGFRIVFVLRDVEGLSTEETAETLGLSIPAVKSRLLRARLQLRERLSRYFRRNKVGEK